MFTLQQGSLPGGDAGTEKTLAVMRRLVLSETALPLVRMTAARIAANVPGNDPVQVAQQIRRFVKARWRFVRDPLDKELLHTPEALLRMLQTDGQIAADCDDAAILCAALGVSVGLRARFVAVAFLDERAPYAHVWTELAPPTGTGSWVECDVTRSMQTLPAHLFSRHIIFPVISDDMRTLRGTTSGRDDFRSPVRGLPNASPFSDLGAYPGVAFGLSGDMIAEALSSGLAGPTWAEQITKAETLLTKTDNAMIRKMLVSKIADLRKKIAAKQKSLAPYLPAQPVLTAAPSSAPTPPSPTDAPSAPQPVAFPQPILLAPAPAPPSPSDFAPSQSFTPQPLPFVASSGGALAPSGFMPVNAVDAGEGEQPSSGEAGSGASGGGLLSSPWLLAGAGLLALLLLRGSRSSR